MGGWMDGCVDRWMRGWMDGWMDVWMDGWNAGWTNWFQVPQDTLSLNLFLLTILGSRFL